MTSNHAPFPDQPADPDPGPGPAGGPRSVQPVAGGVAPAPSAARQVDWSGDRQAAAVGRLVEAAGRFDRIAADLVEALVRAIADDACEQTLGVPVEVLLAQTCRHVGFERTTLLRVATTLVHMPAVRHAFVQGWISWSQVRAIVTAARRVDAAGRDRIDTLVADLAVSHADFEADHLVWEVDALADRLESDRVRDRDATPVADNRLAITPRLDGSGSFHGDYDPAHFTPMVEVIDHHATTLDPDTGGSGDHGEVEDLDRGPTSVQNDRALTAAHRHAAAMARRRAGRRADALFELATGTRAGTFTPVDPHDLSGRADRVPSVLLTCHVDTLIGDGAGMPAHVLSRLAGRMKVTADVARRWVAAGAATRLIAVDDVGEVVGVGRRRRFADGWLRDAVVARDLHDTAPASTTPARLCDVDHVDAWPDGPTDLPNLTLISRRTHTAKTNGTWRLDRHRDGTRTWTATRSGYQVRQPRPTHLPRPPDPQPKTDPAHPRPDHAAPDPPAGKDPPDPRAP